MFLPFLPYGLMRIVVKCLDKLYFLCVLYICIVLYNLESIVFCRFNGYEV